MRRSVGMPALKNLARIGAGRGRIAAQIESARRSMRSGNSRQAWSQCPPDRSRRREAVVRVELGIVEQIFRPRDERERKPRGSQRRSIFAAVSVLNIAPIPGMQARPRVDTHLIGCKRCVGRKIGAAEFAAKIFPMMSLVMPTKTRLPSAVRTDSYTAQALTRAGIGGTGSVLSALTPCAGPSGTPPFRTTRFRTSAPCLSAPVALAQGDQNSQTRRRRQPDVGDRGTGTERHSGRARHIGKTAHHLHDSHPAPAALHKDRPRNPSASNR